MYLAIANYKQLEFKVKFFFFKEKDTLLFFLSEAWLGNGFTRVPLQCYFLEAFVWVHAGRVEDAN